MRREDVEARLAHAAQIRDSIWSGETDSHSGTLKIADLQGELEGAMCLPYDTIQSAVGTRFVGFLRSEISLEGATDEIRSFLE